MKRARAAFIATAALAAAAAPAPAATPPPTFTLESARVVHRTVFFGGRPLALRFRFQSDGPLDVQIRIERLDDGREASSQVLPAAAPGQTQKVSWDGVTDKGKAAHDARYRVLVGPAGGRLHKAAKFTLHGHVFPVRGRHSERGAIGRFGAPRSGGRRHVAARAGRVTRRAYDPVLDGNYLIVQSLLEGRDYWYVHLRAPSPFKRGDTVSTGQLIGRVGDTGNARTVGCHLHFELHVGGKPVDPEPHLYAWDRWSPGR